MFQTHNINIVSHLRATTAITSAFALFFTSSVSYAAPQGGVVSGGNAVISSSGQTTTIDQASRRAIINWDSFNVSSGETVQFNQPSSSAVTLNRIHDAQPSFIDGAINANGTVFFINQNGILFGQNATVNVGGVLATTSDIGDRNFMKGHYVFDKPGDPNATISNAGTINIVDHGFGGFVGPNVTNTGTIQVNVGKVQLASGDKFVLDLYGDGLISIQASDAITQQLVENNGSIRANGGQIEMTAAAANNAIGSVINMGSIAATNVKKVKGNIILTSGSGDVSNYGTINADKSVTINAQDVTHNGYIGSNEVDITAANSYTATRFSQIVTGDSVSINAADVTHNGSITANDVSITADNSYSAGRYSQIRADDVVSISAQDVTMGGSISSRNSFVGGNVVDIQAFNSYTSGQYSQIKSRNVSISAQDVTINGSINNGFVGGNEIDITATNSIAIANNAVIQADNLNISAPSSGGGIGPNTNPAVGAPPPSVASAPPPPVDLPPPPLVSELPPVVSELPLPSFIHPAPASLVYRSVNSEASNSPVPPLNLNIDDAGVIWHANTIPLLPDALANLKPSSGGKANARRPKEKKANALNGNRKLLKAISLNDVGDDKGKNKALQAIESEGVISSYSVHHKDVDADMDAPDNTKEASPANNAKDLNQSSIPVNKTTSSEVVGGEDSSISTYVHSESSQDVPVSDYRNGDFIVASRLKIPVNNPFGSVQ